LSKITAPREFARSGQTDEIEAALRVVAAGTIGNVLEWYDFAMSQWDGAL
jgi:hypothetical protein